MHVNRRLWTGPFAMLLVCASIVGSSGCASMKGSDWNWRGEGFGKEHKEASDQVGRMRSQDKSLLQWGVSTKAQEIERNLGAY